LVLPFWYRLTWVVPEKGPLNGCMYVCMYVVYLLCNCNSKYYLLAYYMLDTDVVKGLTSFHPEVSYWTQ